MGDISSTGGEEVYLRGKTGGGMIKKESHLKKLDGCEYCKRRCQFNGNVAVPGGNEIKGMYPCHSIRRDMDDWLLRHRQ